MVDGWVKRMVEGQPRTSTPCLNTTSDLHLMQCIAIVALFGCFPAQGKL